MSQHHGLPIQHETEQRMPVFREITSFWKFAKWPSRLNFHLTLPRENWLWNDNILEIETSQARRSCKALRHIGMVYSRRRHILDFFSNDGIHKNLMMIWCMRPLCLDKFYPSFARFALQSQSFPRSVKLESPFAATWPLERISDEINLR